MGTIDNFVSDMSPMRQARAKQALNVVMTQNGFPYTRAEIVERMVHDGARIVTHPLDIRRLQLPNRAYVEQARLTKTAMDYAEYLIALPLFGKSV